VRSKSGKAKEKVKGYLTSEAEEPKFLAECFDAISEGFMLAFPGYMKRGVRRSS
jgi:hypothetical protein